MQIEEPVQKLPRRRLRRVQEDSDEEVGQKPESIIHSPEISANAENTRPSKGRDSSFKSRLLRLAMEGAEAQQPPVFDLADDADDAKDDEDFSLNVDNDTATAKIVKQRKKKAPKAPKPLNNVSTTLKTGNKLIGDIADTDLLND